MATIVHRLLKLWRWWSTYTSLCWLNILYTPWLGAQSQRLSLTIYKYCKWFLRHTVYGNRCEIQRLLDTQVQRPYFTTSPLLSTLPPSWLFRLTQSIYHSQYLGNVWKTLVTASEDTDYETLAIRIQQTKRFPYASDAPQTLAYTGILGPALERIHQAQLVQRALQERKLTAVNSTLAEHKDTLLHIWQVLAPVTQIGPEALDTLSLPQWPAIGFQSADPVSDFRGMGALGLDCLDYYVTHYPESARFVLMCSRVHPTAWYSFAIVTINLANLGWRLVQSPEFQYYLYSERDSTSPNVYFELCCYLFHTFNDFWFIPNTKAGTHPPLSLWCQARADPEKEESSVHVLSVLTNSPAWPQAPYTIMNFESVLPTFEKRVRHQLRFRLISPTLASHSFICGIDEKDFSTLLPGKKFQADISESMDEKKAK
ncbi:hypothetical protein IWQ62_006064 [Dispira parvispora]|uniref:ELMO domain-containing protein n=1 Tax=Dispira parvispora TaxID=1520584 RepID=A0A9W8ANR4_9FUNG|nr:hypothetical protein IWQ62_006064 [Dispira parvispora]